MKRCPECYFIYEDDQDLCEMDGKELVHDPRSFPDAVNTATKQGLRGKSLLRSFVALGTAFLLAAVLFVVYYASPRRVNSKPAPVVPNIGNSKPEPSIPPPAPNAPAEDQTEASLATTDAPSESASDAAVTRRRSPRPPARPSVLPTPGPPSTATPVQLLSQSPAGVPVTVLTSKRPSSNPAAPVAPKLDEAEAKAPNQKKESTLGSFFRKAARVLKKPFSSKPTPK